jgi:hypothetical protein
MLTGMKLNADTFTVSGGGALDIGKQQVALSLFPEFKDKKAGLNGYGLPIRLSGGWDGIGLSLDWDFLKDKAVAGLQAKAGAEIQDELKQIGDGLRGKLGLGKTPTGTQAPATTPAPAPAAQPGPAAAAPPAAETPQSAQDRLRAEAQKALDRALGKKD